MSSEDDTLAGLIAGGFAITDTLLPPGRSARLAGRARRPLGPAYSRRAGWATGPRRCGPTITPDDYAFHGPAAMPPMRRESGDHAPISPALQAGWRALPRPACWAGSLADFARTSWLPPHTRHGGLPAADGCCGRRIEIHMSAQPGCGKPIDGPCAACMDRLPQLTLRAELRRPIRHRPATGQTGPGCAPGVSRGLPVHDDELPLLVAVAAGLARRRPHPGEPLGHSRRPGGPGLAPPPGPDGTAAGRPGPGFPAPVERPDAAGAERHLRQRRGLDPRSPGWRSLEPVRNAALHCGLSDAPAPGHRDLSAAAAGANLVRVPVITASRGYFHAGTACPAVRWLPTPQLHQPWRNDPTSTAREKGAVIVLVTPDRLQQPFARRLS